MSRAFVKEDAPSEDVIVPARAPLPAGSPNYVTPRGMRLLEQEHAELQARLAELKAADTPGEGQEREQARELTLVSEQLSALNDRIVSAEVVPPDPDSAKVAFGSRVTVRVLSGKFEGDERRLTIVGVDEAESAKQDDGDEALVAFTAPIARALMGSKVGEQVRLEVARREQQLEVLALRGSSI